MGNRFTQIVIVLVIAFFGFILFSNSRGETNTDAPNLSSNHVIGNENSDVTLVEYADFQCPACQAFYPVVKQVVEKYKDDIRFEFRHFPLVQIHPNAFAASRAAEAAGKQGKFFEMHDLLYENQSAWSSLTDPLNTFVSYAKQLSLDEATFRADYASSEVNDIINSDYKKALDIGVSATPTFVLNGKRLTENPGSVEEFEQLIQNALDNK